MILDLVKVGASLIDKIIPDPEAAAQAKLELLRQQQEGKFREIEVQLSAIIAEAQSEDPFTSRARPSFLYVIYILLLSALPMGVLYAITPDTAENITQGFTAWLSAIPEPYIQLFGVGYLGYVGARTIDKRKRP